VEQWLFEHFGQGLLSTHLFNLTPHKSVNLPPFNHFFFRGQRVCQSVMPCYGQNLRLLPPVIKNDGMAPNKRFNLLVIIITAYGKP
jgi:hypothetical protein